MILSRHIYSKEILETVQIQLSTAIVREVVAAVENYGLEPSDAMGAVASALIGLCARFQEPEQSLKAMVQALESDRAREVLEMTREHYEQIKNED